MRSILVIISSALLLSGCSLWNKYIAKEGVQESRVSEQEALKATSGLPTEAERGLDDGPGSNADQSSGEAKIIQQAPIRPKKNEILIKYRNRSSEVILSLDPRDNNVQIDVSKSQGPGGASVPESYGQPMSSYNTSGPEGQYSSQPQKKQMSPSESELLAEAQENFYSGNYQLALQKVNSSINRRPTAQGYALRGSIYYMLGNLAMARKNWVNSLRIDPNIAGVRQMLNKIGY